MFEGTLGNGTIPKEGSGVRMMWYPKKAAFRAGYASGDKWDDINIGDYSIASGWVTTASGSNSTAMGAFTVASGQSSTATGYYTKASGYYSNAMGFYTKAESISSTAIGLYNVGGGDPINTIGSDPLFEIGNGQDEGNRSNALTVLKNGNVGIGTSSPTAELHVTGNHGVLFEGAIGSGTIPKEGSGVRMMWYPKQAAFRAGAVVTDEWDDINIGIYSIAMGAFTVASGESSTAMGYLTTASGDVSTAMGYHTKAQSIFSTAIGIFNIGGGDPLDWINTDPLFEIGNGQYDGNRSNALTVLKNGNVGLGTENPERLLHLNGANPRILIEAASSNPEINLKNNGDLASDIWSLYKNGTTDDLQFYQNGNKVTIQKNTGNVGIGTTNPQGKLDVNGAIYQRGTSLHADFVFEDYYKLESIEDHSEFMWKNKHLKGIPKASYDENGNEYVEVGSHRRGIVEELEKAHIYISQLEERISKLEQIITNK